MLKEITVAEIDNFEGYYIGDNGVVYSTIKKGCRNIKNMATRTELTPMKSRPGKNGYMRVYIRDNTTGKRIDKYVHRLVAETFLDHEPTRNVVNHKNCDRSDNRLENLEWVTVKENTDYTMTHGDLERNPKTGRYQRKQMV